MPKETVTPLNIGRVDKERALRHLSELDEDEVAKLIAQLKVVLLRDADMPDGGLNEPNRRRAWEMVRDLGLMMLKGREQ